MCVAKTTFVWRKDKFICYRDKLICYKDKNMRYKDNIYMLQRQRLYVAKTTFICCKDTKARC